MKYTLLTYGLLMATSALAADTPALDTDGDRLISLAEAQAGAPELASRFSKIDANQDGQIGWQAGEGGLQQAQAHMTLLMKGEGLENAPR